MVMQIGRNGPAVDVVLKPPLPPWPVAVVVDSRLLQIVTRFPRWTNTHRSSGLITNNNNSNNSNSKTTISIQMILPHVDQADPRHGVRCSVQTHPSLIPQRSGESRHLLEKPS